MPLQFVDIVGVIATITVIIMELGPAPAVRAILQTKSVGLTPLVPLVALGTNGWIWTMYGYLGGNIFPVAVSNFVGAVLSVVYTAIFYRFTHERAYAHKIIGFFALFVAAATTYAIVAVAYQPKTEVQRVIGVLAMLTVFMLFASPFENIVLVFRHRNAVFIPIQLVIAGAINCAMWSLYGALMSDYFLFTPNFGALLLGLVQILLYVIYHPSKQPPMVHGVDSASNGVEIPLAKQSAGYGAVHA